MHYFYTTQFEAKMGVVISERNRDGKSDSSIGRSVDDNKSIKVKILSLSCKVRTRRELLTFTKLTA